MDLRPETNATNDTNAQAAVLGSLLIEPKLMGRICEKLRPEDFTDSTYRNLFSAAREIWLAHKPLDAVTLLDKVGGAYRDTVVQAMGWTPTAANWEPYCDIVKNEARLAELRGIAFQVINCHRAEEARELLLQAQRLLTDTPSMKIVHFGDMLQDFMDRMADSETDYLDFGFPQLNEQVQISAGRFVILAAESSVGKTALALQMAVGLARSGKRVGFFSLETSAPDAMDRMMANAANVPLPAIKKKRLDAAAIKRCVDAARTSDQLPLDLIEAAGASVQEMRATTLAERYDVIFIDYVQMIPSRADEPANQVRDVSLALHTLSQQLGVTVIGLSQVTPPPKDKNGNRAELSKDNLRESRQLIHDAEAILIMDLSDRRDYQSPRVLKVDKNKDGPCCRMLLDFDARHMRFTYAPPPVDSAVEAAQRRNEAMDRNRLARANKAAERQRERQAVESAFRELEGDTDEIPF